MIGDIPTSVFDPYGICVTQRVCLHYSTGVSVWVFVFYLEVVRVPSVEMTGEMQRLIPLLDLDQRGSIKIAAAGIR